MDINKTDEYLFDEYFNNINLNEELKEFYAFINDEALNESYKKNTELTNIRNENYKRYSNIDILKINNLPNIYDNIVNEIKKLYELLSIQNLNENNEEEALETKKILDLIYKYYDQLDESLEKDCKLLELENDDNQEKIKVINYQDYDKNILDQILNKYNELVLFNSVIEKDLFENYKRQIKRKQYIKDLYDLTNLKISSYKQEDVTNKINDQINNEKINLYDKILYLEDLMVEKSKYEQEFIEFKSYINSLFAYDDTNYKATYNVYNIIFNELKIKSLLSYFEDSFIKEREHLIKEEKFIYEKYGIKNIKASLDYISANYMEFLVEEEKKLIEQLYYEINSEDYNIENIYNRFIILANNIWEKSITDVYSYNQDDDFCFICTNEEFIDERHESILITKKMLERVNDYYDYQIGFICEFNNNILYITENEDIMTIDYDDLSKLKTPKQLEQEFLNFRVCNRIALNGYTTKISAVYYINDGDFIKYMKAIEMANRHNLPLIVLKKDKI